MKVQTESKMAAWERILSRYFSDPTLRSGVELAVYFLMGFCLSAAGLGNCPQPLCVAVLCAGLSGWSGGCFALGSSLGYWYFWGQAGLLPMGWLLVALPVCTFLPEQKQPLLFPVLGALAVALPGLGFQLWTGDGVSVAMYFLQVALAFAGTCILRLAKGKDPTARCLCMGGAALALAQIAPVQTLNLGLIFGGAVALLGTFPMVAVVGLALDLARISPVSMTAVLCSAYFLGRIPKLSRKIAAVLPGICYLSVMGLCGESQWSAAPALLLGGVASLLVQTEPLTPAEEKEDTFLQIRLERVAGVLTQARQMIRNTPLPPPDEGALIERVADRACGNCPHYMTCTAAQGIPMLPQSLLHRHVITIDNVPADCQAGDRLLMELRSSQDQYRLLLAQRQSRQEYRNAVMEQYGFLAEYLQTVADGIPRQEQKEPPVFRPEVAACSRGREGVNGDRYFRFAGANGRYYVLLCDGMGTGEEAAYEARAAGSMLRRLLSVGYPAQGAMEAINSLCALRDRAGAVTLDLAETDLQTGRVTLYKWGAAPSWVLSEGQREKIGRECLPPGLAAGEDRQSIDRISLQNGEVLALFSDGVDGEQAAEAVAADWEQPPGFLAALMLEAGVDQEPDDATAVVLRLRRIQRNDAGKF